MFFKISSILALLILFSGCGYFNSDQQQSLDPVAFIEAIQRSNLACDVLKTDSRPDLTSAFISYQPFGVYQGENFSFALFNLTGIELSAIDDQNGSLVLLQNQNLILSGKGSNDSPYSQVFQELKPSMTINQLGVFIYPLAICMIVSIFVSSERLYSLRSGLTFPRKVAKALQSGEFPDRKWKKRSSAERIVWVATKENPSVESLRSYARLEITFMQRGLFLLEVVVSAAPLLGLLGTVTGLVKVFSQIPASGGVGNTAIFSEGIAMALLTTIAGLTIAIPTLISHSYIVRLVENRASSIDWLTERLIDAIYPQSKTGTH